MEKRKPLVKNLTKAFTFALCCILCVGCLIIPISASTDNTDTLLSIWGRGVLPTGGYIEVVGENHTVGVYATADEMTLDDYDLSFDTSIYQPQIDQYGRQYVEIRVHTYNTTVFAKQPYIRVYPFENQSSAVDYKLSYIEDTDINIQGVKTDVFVDVPIQDSGDLVTYVGYLTFDEDTTIDPDDSSIDYLRGFEAGYRKGLEEGLEQGGTNGVFKIITDPLTALFGITLVQVEDTTITLGAVFFTIVGVSLMLWFLKYFAGG